MPIGYLQKKMSIKGPYVHVYSSLHIKIAIHKACNFDASVWPRDAQPPRQTDRCRMRK